MRYVTECNGLSHLAPSSSAHGTGRRESPFLNARFLAAWPCPQNGMRQEAKQPLLASRLLFGPGRRPKG